MIIAGLKANLRAFSPWLIYNSTCWACQVRSGISARFQILNLIDYQQSQAVPLSYHGHLRNHLIRGCSTAGSELSKSIISRDAIKLHKKLRT